MSKTTIYIQAKGQNPPTEPGRRWVGWRGLHKAEGGRQAVPLGMPCVLPPINPVALKMTASIQRMAFDLMVAMNPYIDGDDWSKVHKYNVAWCNGNGFYNPGDPRANYILNQDLNYGLPKYDKMQRQMQGSFLTGTAAFSALRMVQNALNLAWTVTTTPRISAAAFRGAVRGLVSQNVLRCRPGVDGIDATTPFPTVQEIIDRNWFAYSVSLGTRDERRIDHFPQGEDLQGNQHPVAVPFIFDRDIQFPLEWFTPWDEDFEPDPTVLYL